MVTPRTEMDDIQELGREHAATYEQVEATFDQFFMARLLADAIAPALPAILANNTIIPEVDGDAVFVLHIASIKLYVHKGLGVGEGNVVGLQLLSHGIGKNAVAIAFHSTADGLQVEYTAVVNNNSPRRFGYLLPDTAMHDLNMALSELHQPILDAFSGGEADPEALKRLVLFMPYC